MSTHDVKKKMYTNIIHMHDICVYLTHPVPNEFASPAAQYGPDHVPPAPNGRFLDCSLCDVLPIVSTVERW